nr:hypothetical protein [Capillimicrobium parvum]
MLVGRVERRGGLLGQWRLGEPGVPLHAAERPAEHDLRDRAPDVGERRPGLGFPHRRVHLPHQHRLVEHGAEQEATDLAVQLGVETEQLVARGRRANPPSRSVMKPSTETLIE